MSRPPPHTNTSKLEIAEHRRALIAHFRIRGFSRQKIFEALQATEPPCVNHATGKPWSVTIITKDCEVLLERWRQQALSDVGKLQARQWAELQEIKHQAWSDKDFSTILKCQERESKLLGLDKQRDPQQGALDAEAQSRIAAHQALTARIAALPADQVVSLMKELASARAALPVSSQEIDVTPESDAEAISDEDSATSETVTVNLGREDDPNADPDADIPEPIPVWRCPVSDRKIA